MAETFKVVRNIFGNQEDSLISITNNEESDLRRYFEVKNITIKPAMVSGTDSRFLIQRISHGPGFSALINPEDNEYFNININKLRSNAPNLPAAVVCRKHTDTVPGATFTLLRRVFVAPFSAIGAGALANINYRTGFGSIQGTNSARTATVLRAGHGDANIEQVLIRENEALIITPNDNANPSRAAAWYININFSFNGNSYFINEVICDKGKKDLIGLDNGTGTIGNIFINSIDMFELGPFSITGEAQDSPKVRILKTFGGLRGGRLITPIKVRSDTTIPTALSVRENHIEDNGPKYAVVTSLDLIQNLGYPLSNTIFVRGIGMVRNLLLVPQNTQVGVNALFASQLNYKGNGNGYSTKQQGIMIRPGEGLAIVCSNFSITNYYTIEVEILHYPPPPPPSASGGTYGYGFI